MAIDKESSGFPEIDPHRATTKVNLAMVFAIGIFFAVLVAAAMYFSHHENESSLRGQSAPIENQPQKSP